jgi:NAD(P)-dependent dehydrogenase (short-subunit alcohol dehydrogenase family)
MDATQIMFRPGLMAGERVLVTGGGTGLGREMAEAFAMLGAEVHIAGRRGGVVEQTAAEIAARHGAKVVGHALDIRVPEAIGAVLDGIWSGHGPLTGLVNNAAGNFISPTERLSPRAFDAIANIVFRGTFFATLDCGKRWIAEGRRASVLSILTTWVWNGSPFTVPSAMSKAGINAMTQSLAVEWARHGIRFNAIAPGPFPTEGMSARLNPGDGGGAYADMSSNPMGRVGEMHELCNLAVFLMAPGAAYVNGQTIAIDGAAWQATGGNFSALTKLPESEWDRLEALIRATNAADKAKRTV